ncbi:MAG: glycerol-3-phosphate 1-O-acyltransferase [Alphaproteobacteria bacterium]|nr:MAG: glycerol-3-phosphate 1-O-acyltransferase [Alphaproteobacteria bacterium]
MPFDQTMILAALFGYLLGSIPFGLLLTRLAGLGDIRNVGSGNIGATNVLRTGNKYIAALTLVLDGGKAAAALLITQAYAPEATLIAAFAAFAGHLYPVWLKFEGGKGVATFVGIALAYEPLMGLVCILTWILTAIVFRYSSLASLVAALAGPIYAGLFLTNFAGSIFALIAALIFWRHSSNIRHLIDGKEPKIGKS